MVEHGPWYRLAHVSDEQPELVALDEPAQDVVVMGPVVVHSCVLLQGCLGRPGAQIIHIACILHTP